MAEQKSTPTQKTVDEPLETLLEDNLNDVDNAQEETLKQDAIPTETGKAEHNDNAANHTPGLGTPDVDIHKDTSEDKDDHADDHAKEDEALMAKLKAAQAEAEKNREGWQRALADFQNYKRRIEKERTETYHKAGLDALTRILPIIDDFERALSNIPPELEGNPWMNGVELIQGKFKKLLEEYDITPLDPAGQPFDPNEHQAISMEDSDAVASGHVIETLQKGYKSGEALLRPALVKVAN